MFTSHTLSFPLSPFFLCLLSLFPKSAFSLTSVSFFMIEFEHGSIMGYYVASEHFTEDKEDFCSLVLYIACDIICNEYSLAVLKRKQDV